MERERHFDTESDILGGNYYEILGISPSADFADIKMAFRNLAKVHHPDAGGNEENFKKLSEAYIVLSDPEKRKKYDRTNSIHDTKPQSHTEEKKETKRDSHHSFWSDRLKDLEMFGFGNKKDFKKRYEEMMRELIEHKEKLEQQLQEEGRESKRRFDEEEKELKRQIQENLEKKKYFEQKIRDIDSGKEPRFDPRFEAKKDSSSEDPEGRSFKKGNVKIKKDGIFYYLVDDKNKHISSGFEGIEERNGLLIGKSVTSEYILDSITGKQLSNGYDCIEMRSGMVIGRTYTSEYLLDPRTGKQFSHGYESIEMRNGFIIGKSYTAEYLLDSNNGKQLSDGFEKIEMRDDLVIGKSYTSEYLLDPKNGKKLSKGFHRIEKRGGKIIGKGILADEEIKI